MSNIDLTDWRLPDEVLQYKLAPKRAPQPKRGQRFLRGPIPMEWLSQAANLSGKALSVAIANWHQSGLLRGAAEVHLSPILLRELGVQRHSAYRALRAWKKQDWSAWSATVAEPRE